ncbi:restriction endonuclease subunit S [Pseudoalteromonas sp. B131b]|uniref:restriction endonuclease subunit S n=1 Tax=Pseudoalteromonas sp. B131b TaxID=630493 RepID=UPI00301B8EFD
MGSDWIDCELGDLIELKRGYDLPKTKRVNGGVPVVSSSGSSGEHNEIKVKAPGVVTGRYGTIGEVFYIEDDFWPLNTTLYVKDFKGNDPLYVYYFLKTIRYSDYTDKGAVPGINRNHIHRAKVKVPVDPLHQRNLALKLFDLDKKIQLNKQTNQTLEKMAQALFKSWFVDFDPVFDNLLASADFKLENLETSLPDELIQKAQRRLTALNSLHNATQCKASLSALAHELQAQLPTKEATQAAEKGTETPVKANFNANPTILAQHANTHAHFPNEFEHNEQLGWIPKGWSVSNVEGISAKVFSGGTPNTRTSEYWNGELHWFSSGETRSNLVLDTEKRITEEGVKNSSTKLSIPGDILIAGAGQGHTRGQTSLNRIHTYFNQSVVCIRVKDVKLSNWLFENLHSRYEEMRALSDSHSVRGSLTTKIVARMQVLLPCDNLIDIFNKNAKAYSIRQEKLLSEISVLTKLRDTLLPKLISGELQIPDVATNDETVD